MISSVPLLTLMRFQVFLRARLVLGKLTSIPDGHCQSSDDFQKGKPIDQGQATNQPGLEKIPNKYELVVCLHLDLCVLLIPEGHP